MQWKCLVVPAWIVLLVVASLLLFYTGFDKQSKSLKSEKVAEVLAFSDSTKSWRELNKVAALAGLGLISLAFIFGPLSRLWPRIFGRCLAWRKALGLSGFALVLFHAAYSAVVFYQLDVNRLFFENSLVIGTVSGVIALIIFLLMTLTSTQKIMQAMGYSNWKALQTTGYVALFFSIVHFWLLETKPVIGFDVRPFGLLFFWLAVAALLLRLAMIALRQKPKTSFEAHVVPPDKELQK